MTSITVGSTTLFYEENPIVKTVPLDIQNLSFKILDETYVYKGEDPCFKEKLKILREVASLCRLEDRPRSCNMLSRRTGI